VTQEQGGQLEGGILKNTTSTPEAMGKFLDHQGTDHYNPKKYESQDQLRTSTPEAMVKIGPLETPHPSYSEFFHNLHDGDEFTTYAVTMGGTVERPVEIHTSALVLIFSLTHAPFAISLQDVMAIILERSQVETFLAPTEWATFIRRGNVGITIEVAMAEFAVDITFEVRRKTQLDDEVSSEAPWMEVHTDEARMLRERGPMTSTVESHSHLKRCRGVHPIYYALLDRKSSTEVLQKHLHPNSRGGQEGWVSLGVSIEAGNKLECSSPRAVSYEPGCVTSHV
jgi:hypothetical protein